MRLAETLRAVERWLLPAECLLCREPLGEADEAEGVCGICRARWPLLPEPRCATCGQPREPALDCRICTDWPAGFGSVQSAVWLRGTARDAVHWLKYRGWHRVAAALAATMARRCPLGGDALALVPVPLGRARLRQRGYNQAALLAVALGTATGIPVVADALARVRETATQTDLPPAARLANVQGAFHGTWRSRAVPVLVDDVFTTGATLRAAAEALRDGGAPEVRGVTFARATRPLEVGDEV